MRSGCPEEAGRCRSLRRPDLGSGPQVGSQPERSECRPDHTERAARERVIEDALERGGVDPAEVGYLEAHGTGTKIGDPIEIRAAAAVYGRGRHPYRPLLVGSAKTNIGHPEVDWGRLPGLGCPQ